MFQRNNISNNYNRVRLNTLEELALPLAIYAVCFDDPKALFFCLVLAVMLISELTLQTLSDIANDTVNIIGKALRSH